MAKFSNPYLLQDIMIIIDSYTDPSTGEEVSLTPKDYIANLPKILDAKGGGHWAQAADKLQERLDEARGAIDTLYSYGTVAQGKSTSVDVPGFQGIEMQNTWYTLTDADNIGDAAKTLVADCIPCKDRVLALFSVNPLDDLWEALEKMYDMSVSFLLELYDLLLGDKSVEFFADICSLFQFLNFMCIPDLYTMIIVLSQLISKYLIKLKDLKVTFNDILGKIMAPSLAPLFGLIDKYIQLIIAPIKCVIDALDAQLQKLDVMQAWEKATGNQAAERSFSLGKVGGALAAAEKYMLDAVDTVEEDAAKIRKSINDFLNLRLRIDEELFDVSYHIEMVMRIIGVIQGVILALQQGAIVCGPENNGEEELKNFFDNYVSAQFDLDIVVQDNEIKIRPSTPEDLHGLLDVLGTLRKEKDDKNLPSVVEPLQVAEVTIPIKNCLYTTTDDELEKVKDFLGTFKEGE